jgi:hypothetical protein
MRPLESFRWRALIVVLLLGFAALTLHASMHTQPDQQSCEICGGHFNPTHAVAPSTSTPILYSPAPRLEPFSPHTVPSESFTSYRQRAPPIPG